jgi:hypothetical protein
VTAPLLVAMGWGPVRAVAYPLIGYHWSVTFGSMGSSFYMASLTAGLTSAEQPVLAGYAALFLALNCVLAGMMVLLLDGGPAGLREGGRVLLLVGVPMGAALVAVALLVPAIATLAAATVGFAVVFVLAVSRARKRTNVLPVDVSEGVADVLSSQNLRLREDEPRRGVLLLAPYIYLLVVALPVFLLPSTRDWVTSHLSFGPDFTATTTGLGWTNAPVADYSPLALLAHPGTCLTVAAVLGHLAFPALRAVARPRVEGRPEWLGQGAPEILLLHPSPGQPGHGPGRLRYGFGARARLGRDRRRLLSRGGSTVRRSGLFHDRLHDLLQRAPRVLPGADRRAAPHRAGGPHSSADRRRQRREQPRPGGRPHRCQRSRCSRCLLSHRQSLPAARGGAARGGQWDDRPCHGPVAGPVLGREISRYQSDSGCRGRERRRAVDRPR